MIPEDDKYEQNRRLKQMDYNPDEDMFNQEEHVPLDGDGNPVIDDESQEEDKIDKGLDIPGVEEDDEMEETGTEDEENNFWSLSDNEDDHEEENTDLID